eukprot:COSAG01_NODE_14834_length_1405_cov_0.743492_2_plen_160_part_01
MLHQLCAEHRQEGAIAPASYVRSMEPHSTPLACCMASRLRAAANVLLSTRELATAVPKVCDFGVATVVQQTMVSMSGGGGGGLTGTLAWKAPETFAGDYTSASDCFALGVIDYELATRQEPWAGLSVAEIMSKASAHFAYDESMFDDFGLEGYFISHIIH